MFKTVLTNNIRKGGDEMSGKYLRNCSKKLMYSIAAMCFAMMLLVGFGSVNVHAETAEGAATTKENVVITVDSGQTVALYAESDSEMTENLLAEVAAEGSSYTTALPKGNYRLYLKGASDAALGSMKITVTAEGEPTGLGDMATRNHFDVVALTGIKATNEGWVYGTDYTMTITAYNNSFQFNRETVMGADAAGNITAPVLDGDNVTVKMIPDESKTGYVPIKVEKTVNRGYETFPETEIPQGVEVSFQVPKGAVADAGTFGTYYVFDFKEAIDVDTTGEDFDVYTFGLPKNTNCFYRVKSDSKDAVTYWNYATWAENTTVTVSEADLCIGDDSFNADTIFSHYEKSKYDLADIYLNINEKGYLNLEKGEEFAINAFRNWYLIAKTDGSNDKVVLPDFDYQVIDFNGNPSDVVSVKAGEKNSGQAVLSADKEGTAIVLVTYDAVTDMAASIGNQYSAIWPERTGVFVVSVGEEDAVIDTGMTVNAGANYTESSDKWWKNAHDAIDAEHDILFYTGTEGASYTFVPEAGTSVSVARATLTADSLTYSGFTTDGVAINDGAVTVSGLKSGRHIVKLEKDGKATYQVVTARAVSYTLDKAVIKPGDSVNIQFTGLTNPVEKMSGVYNFNANVHYFAEDGTEIGGGSGGIGVYGFSSDASQQKIKITIPENWDKENYTLAGGNIRLGGFGWAAGEHRSTTYEKGLGQNFAAQAVDMYLGVLPEISIPITPLAHADVSFDCNVENAQITVKDGSGTVLAPEDGIYKDLTDGEYAYEVLAEGYVSIREHFIVDDDHKGAQTIKVEMKALSETDWDGSTAKEPAAVNDVYQIGTGAELAWFANAVNGGQKSIDAVLTDDISLAGFAWTPISGSYAGTFDGQGHDITGLYINATTGNQGLFGSVSGAKISNLAVYGSVSTTASSSSIAGIVGSAAGATTVTGCANFADVSGKKNVAGIIGKMATTASINSCYNAGTITVTTSLGGGLSGGYSLVAQANTINNSYNSGKLICTKDGGSLTASTKAKVTNGFYLAGTYAGTSASGTSVTAAELSDLAGTLGEPFVSDGKINKGYPVFAWQKALKGSIKVQFSFSFEGNQLYRRAELTVKDRNQNGIFDVDDAFICAHETYYEGGAAGYATYESYGSLFMSSLWGDDSGGFGYYLNHHEIWSLTDEIKEGDHLYGYVFEDKTGWADSYCYLDKEEATVRENEELTLTLMHYIYDESWNVVSVPVEGATAMVDGEATAYITDAAGNVSLKLQGVGEKTISFAAPEGMVLTPVFCTVTVTKAESEGKDEPVSKVVKVKKITLSGISKRIAAGKKIKLTAKISPSNAKNKAVTWKSSNKKVATVSSTGLVTFKKKTGGKYVTITATAKDGSKVKASYRIRSMKGIVKKVAIKGKTSVKNGKKLYLKAKVTASKGANKTLKWTSSNTKYATVTAKGTVTAKKAGKGKTVTITAKATDGSGKKAVKKIKIK